MPVDDFMPADDFDYFDDPAIPETLSESRAARPALSPREREVLTWAARGKSAWETATILGITSRTVDKHIQTAFRKLGATNRTHAVAIALRERLIEP